MTFFSSCRTVEELKQEYRKLAKQYHPDVNHETDTTAIMQEINALYDILLKKLPKTATNQDTYTQDEANADNFRDIISKVAHLDIIIEICGNWVWLSGNTYKYKDVIKAEFHKRETATNDITETEQETDKASQTVQDIADIILDYSAVLLMDWETMKRKTYETSEEKTEYKTALTEKLNNITVTAEIIETIRGMIGNGLLVDTLEQIAGINHNSNNSSEEETQDDFYNQKPKEQYLYHDLHFAAWDISESEIKNMLDNAGIEYDYTGSDFICQGLTISAIAYIEYINEKNGACIYYDKEYNSEDNNSNEHTEQTENTHNSEAMNETLSPYEYGYRAFQKGMKCVPALDNEFINTYIVGLKVGEKPELTQEWLKGWHTANLAEPVNYNDNSSNNSEPETEQSTNEKPILSAENEPKTAKNVLNFAKYKNDITGDENMNDDILSAFDNINIENNSRISKDDQEFCENQEKLYIEAKTLFTNTLEQMEKIYATYKEENWRKDGYIEEHGDIWKMRDRIKEIKESYISKIVYHFERKYNVTIEGSKIIKKYEDKEINYNTVLDEIFIQLGGYSFEEKAVKEIKDNMKTLAQDHWEKNFKGTIKNNKVIFDSLYLTRYCSIFKRYEMGYDSRGNANKLFKALSHFDHNSTEAHWQFTNYYYKDNSRDAEQYIFTKLELDLDKVKSMKLFKNGKVEIEFKTSQQALQFAKEYCGYNEKAA